MLTISQRLTASEQSTVQSTRPADGRLVLPYDLRSRSRFRAQLLGGEQVGVILERGHVLRGGDRLLADDGRVIEVAAAPETVSVVHGADPQLLARAAYHLGNRHVMLQIGEGWLRYQHDHVLDDMVRGLGLNVGVEQAPFEPEAGAYAADGGHTHAMQGHAHGHGHIEYDHEYDHDHDHDH